MFKWLTFIFLVDCELDSIDNNAMDSGEVAEQDVVEIVADAGDSSDNKEEEDSACEHLIFALLECSDIQYQVWNYFDNITF